MDWVVLSELATSAPSYLQACEPDDKWQAISGELKVTEGRQVPESRILSDANVRESHVVMLQVGAKHVVCERICK